MLSRHARGHAVFAAPMNYQFQFDAVFAAWPLLLKGTWITIQLSLSATVIGLVVAIFCAWGKTSGPGWLRFVVNAYILSLIHI